MEKICSVIDAKDAVVFWDLSWFGAKGVCLFGANTQCPGPQTILRTRRVG